MITDKGFEVARIYRPLNILVSIPAIDKQFFNHLETVDEIITFWGFTKLPEIPGCPMIPALIKKCPKFCKHAISFLMEN